MRAKWLAVAVCLVAATAASAADSALAQAVKKMTRGSKWTKTGEVVLQFKSGHPQGLVKIGDDFYVSTVEIITRTQRYPELRDGYDRDTGEGKGFVYKFSKDGKLLSQVELGEGSVYHPGGIDYDGKYIWVPVAEYRPNSASLMYKVDPATMKAEKVFGYKDHVGGIVHDTDNSSLHGVSWGSRRFYRWPMGADGRIGETETPREKLMQLNTSMYIDYQDCHYIGNGQMLCSGLNNYKKDDITFGLGGIEIVDLKTGLTLHQVPVEHWSPKSGKPMTQNPFWMEEKGGKIMAYFIPDDDDSTMYIYEIAP